MDSFIKEVKAQLYERATNPFLGCFVLSWFLWNWSIVLGILFANGYEGKYLAVVHGMEHSGAWYATLWLLPALSSLAYIIFYPWLARAVFWYWESRQKELKALRQKIEDETPITQEEAFRLRRANREEIRQLEGQLDELQKRNQELMSSLTVKEQQLLALEVSTTGLQNDSSKPAIDNEADATSVSEPDSSTHVSEPKPILQRYTAEAINRAKEYLSVHNEKVLIPFLALLEGDGVTATQLAARAGVNKIIVDHGLTQLEQIGAVNFYGGSWYLSDNGKQIAIDSDLVGV